MASGETQPSLDWIARATSMSRVGSFPTDLQTSPTTLFTWVVMADLDPDPPEARIPEDRPWPDAPAPDAPAV